MLLVNLFQEKRTNKPFSTLMTDFSAHFLPIHSFVCLFVFLFSILVLLGPCESAIMADVRHPNITKTG